METLHMEESGILRAGGHISGYMTKHAECLVDDTTKLKPRTSKLYVLPRPLWRSKIMVESLGLKTPRLKCPFNSPKQINKQNY